MMGPEELASLVDEHAAALVLYARQWSPQPEDIVQEALLKLMAQRTPPARLLPWLYRVVRNAAISHGRSARRRQKHESAAAARRPSWFLPHEGDYIDAAAAVYALETLGPQERETVVAHLWGGLSFEEIGELMTISSSTAHRWYVSGLESLRQKLGVPCPTQPPKAK